MVPITIRPDEQGRWWALNKRESGWASYGLPFAYLGEAIDRFSGRVVGWGRDKFGLYLSVEAKYSHDWQNSP